MRIVLIGKSGQVATEIRRQVSAGDSLVVLARPEFDLSDLSGIERKLDTVDADVIINAAAYTAVDQAESEPELAHRINAEAPGLIARLAAAKDIPFLHVSTDYVYDGLGEEPFPPDAAAGPLNAYGRSKLTGDLGVIAAGGPHAVLRTSWVFSAHGGNFVKTMLRLGRTREKLTIVADQVGGPTPAAAIAGALLKMAESLVSYRPSGYLRTESLVSYRPSDNLRTDGAPLSGVYHFAGAPSVSWADFAREIFRQADMRCEVEDIPTLAYPNPARRPANSRLDCNSLTETFGIAQPDWRKGLADVLEELSNAPA